MMKKITLLLFILSLTISAQEKKQDFFNFRYVGLTLEAGNTVGTGIDLNYTYKDEISLGFGCVDGFYTPENYPTEYNTDDAFIDGDSSIHIYFTVGKIVKVKRFKKIRFNVSAGLAYTKHYVNENYVPSSQVANEYSFDTKTQNDVSLVLNPKLEISLLSWAGFQLSPKVVLNKRKSFYGLGFGLMLGRLYTSKLKMDALDNKEGNNSTNKEVGQEKKQSNLGLVYITGALEIGNYLGLSTDLNYIYKENISFSLGWMGNLFANDYPSDYVDDSDIFSFGPGVADSSHIYFTVGKFFKMGKIKNLRFNLSGGLAISNYSIEENFVRREQVRDGYYYDSEYNEYTKVGLVLNPKIEFPFSSWVGFQISPKVILNTKQNFYGISFGLLLGKVTN